MTRWLASLRDRPLGEHEQRGALALVLVLFIASAVGLALTRTTPQHAGERSPVESTTVAASRTPQAATSTPSVDVRSRTGEPPVPAAARTSRIFLAGYLAYLYGHAPASHIRDATAALDRSLRAHPPRVSPVLRKRDPRIVALHTTPARAGLLGAQALINDGGLIDYPIILRLEDHDGRLLVSGLGGEG